MKDSTVADRFKFSDAWHIIKRRHINCRVYFTPNYRVYFTPNYKEDYERQSREYGKGTVVAYFTAVEGLTLQITAISHLDRFTF
jgi:hypothetical protein